MARCLPTGEVNFYLADHLGSSRVVTDAAGTIPPLDDCDFLPFGGERCVTSATANTYKFTGLERDAESGLDHTLARQYASTLGRWLTPDPAGKAAVRITNPQSWNHYGYALNSPLRFSDPRGLYICAGTSEDCGAFEAARRETLKSKKAAEVRAAKAYGDLGVDNGVNVRFADKLKGDRGGTVKPRGAGVELDPNDPTKGRAAVDVTIQRSNRGNKEVIMHEGSHVADRQEVVEALNRGDMEAVGRLNITHREGEVRAYQLSIDYSQRGNVTLNFGPCGLQSDCKFPPGMMPAKRDQLINELLD